MPMPYNDNTFSFDEHRWLSLVRSALSESNSNEEDDKVKVQISIFFVPKDLLYLKPEAFRPQMFAVGPYHHWVPHLYDMERYKLEAARKIQRDLNSLTIQELVCRLMKHGERIRSHYHKYLDFTGETLAWMMVIDASFLLDFLRNFTAEIWKEEEKLSQWDAPTMRTAYNTVARDVLMLENQIPIFLLRKILRRCRQFSSLKLAEEELSKTLVGFVKEVSPFKTRLSSIKYIDVKKHEHLLQLLYCMIVPKVKEEEFCPSHEIDLNDVLDSSENEAEVNPGGSMKAVFDSVWSYAANANEGATIETIESTFCVGPMKFFIELPWKIISNFPGISNIKQSIVSRLSRGSVKQEDDGHVSDGSNSVSKPPCLEEVNIPSVTELAEAGVRFMPSNGDLKTIRFDMKKKPATIYLPTVILDMNTEVVLRNLVAYEASAEPGPMVFSRYTEFMNGIIDTEEDVKLLRKQKIIVNRLKNDKEVADLWNGMSRCVRPSKVKFLDEVFEDVNSYYDSKWKVKIKRFISKHVFGSWQCLTFLAAIALLLLTCLQTFCNVYSCGERWFNISKLE